MKIVISHEAMSDMKEIFDYIALDSLRYAKETTQNIRSCIHKLKDSPYLGRYVPELEDKQYRELLYKSYRIIYSILEDNNKIYIHFVIHTARNFQKFFQSYLEDMLHF